MLDQTSGTIYLSERRQVFQTATHRSYRMFPAETERPGFGALRRFDDDTLGGGYTYQGQIESGSTLLLLPVVGGVVFSTPTYEQVAEAGSLLAYPADGASDFTLVNPYADALVNYLLLNLALAPAGPRRIDFDLDTAANELLPIWDGPGAYLSIGKFGGRQEGRYRLRDTRHGLFAFAIAGAFEVENRLLADRDALWLPTINEVEFEALSQEGILLLWEVRNVI